MTVAESKLPRDSSAAFSQPLRATFFLKLQLQNVRCFGPIPQTLDLSDGSGRPARWTIIIGENGTGKTTLLQILAGFQSVPYQAPSFPDDTYDVPRVVVYFQTDTSLRILRGPSAVAPVEATVANLSDLEEAAKADQIGTCKFLLSQTSVQDFKWEFQPPICYGYGAARRPAGANLTTDTRSLDGAATLYEEDATMRGAEDWLLKADYSASKPSPIREDQRRHLSRVKELLTSVLPGVTGIRFTEPTRTSPIPAVQFKTPYGWVPYSSLGLGYRSMVTWMIDLVSRLTERYPDSSDPLAEPAVVILDEIDLHLHPAWQRTLVGKLTELFTNTQFIVTAHSPLIVQGAKDANVVVLKREGDHVVIDSTTKPLHGGRIDQILTSDLFGIPTARPAEFDKQLARRKELLSKSKLNKFERQELTKLEADIGTLPTGETDEDARRMLKLAEESQELLKRYAGK